MEGDNALTNETLFREECSIPLEVLDFIQNFNQSDLELIWPCQVRYYWLNLQSFVKVVRILLAYVTPFVIILGVILNIISFSMLSKSVSDSGLSLYLRALAISDNGALIFDYGVGVARSNFSAFNNLFMNSKFLCCMNSVCMEFFQITSTWLVVSLTWARVTAIIFPFQTFNKNHDRFAVIVIITLTCLSLAVSLTKLYCGGYESDSVFEYVTCQKIIIPWGTPLYFYIAFCTWLPLLFVFIGNVLLIFHMRKSEVIHVQLTGKHFYDLIILH